MSFIAAAIIGAVGVGAGALISSHASHEASQAATQAATQNNQLQEQIYNQNTSNIQPWMLRGNAAGAAQGALLGLGGDVAGQRTALDNYANSAGLDYQIQQGNRAINASAAARGNLHSGATLKALQDRGQQIGATYFDRYLTQLQNVSQQGLGGANALAGVGSGYANAVSANNDSAASAVGNAALSSAANTNTLLGSLAQTGGYLAGSGAFGGSSSSYAPAGHEDAHSFGGF